MQSIIARHLNLVPGMLESLVYFSLYNRFTLNEIAYLFILPYYAPLEFIMKENTTTTIPVTWPS